MTTQHLGAANKLHTTFVIISFNVDNIITYARGSLVIIIWDIEFLALYLGLDQSYCYTTDRLAHQLASSTFNLHPDQHFAYVYMPLNISAWHTCLWHHPNAYFAQYILKGLQEDFHIRASSRAHLQSAHTNMLSARQHPHNYNRRLATCSPSLKQAIFLALILHTLLLQAYTSIDLVLFRRNTSQKFNS